MITNYLKIALRNLNRHKGYAIVSISGLALGLVAGYYIIQQWLDDFAYRISIRPEIFVVTALVTIVIAITTVSFKVIRAGAKNPIDALRVE